MADTQEGSAALAALEVLVGVWAVTVPFPDAPTGRVVFEWALDGQYLLQRSTVRTQLSRTPSH